MSVVERALLARELKRLRVSSDRTLEEVASSLYWSVSKLIRIEGGTVGVQTTDVRALLDYYEITDHDVIARLVEISRSARTRDWWAPYRNVHNQEFLTYVGYETGAASITQVQSLVIPGLLQTEEYAREIARAFRVGERDTSGDVVEFRLERQAQVFGRQNPPKQTYLLDEAVIVRSVGMPGKPGIMRNQLLHLVELASRPEITIEVIPFTAGAHPGLRGPFTLLGFENRLDEVLYIESAQRGDLTLYDSASADLIADYHEAFETLRGVSLGTDDSVKRIIRAADECCPPIDGQHPKVTGSPHPP